MYLSGWQHYPALHKNLLEDVSFRNRSLGCLPSWLHNSKHKQNTLYRKTQNMFKRFHDDSCLFCHFVSTSCDEKLKFRMLDSQLSCVDIMCLTWGNSNFLADVLVLMPSSTYKFAPSFSSKVRFLTFAFNLICHVNNIQISDEEIFTSFCTDCTWFLPRK